MSDRALVVVLAFANEAVGHPAYLRNVREEQKRLHKLWQPLADEGKCGLVELSGATLADLFDVFQNPHHRGRIALLHYGGHADGGGLLLENAQGGTARAHGEGLASFLGDQRGLQMVFLNGCSTQPQVEALQAAGIPAIIATSQRIDDEAAMTFAERFYAGLIHHLSLKEAFSAAADLLKSQHGNDLSRLYRHLHNPETGPGPAPGADRYPWDLYLRPGAEGAGEWNLPSALRDPLLGLPPLPPTDLPPSPFRSILWFERQHAPIFFGRGQDILSLYRKVRAEHGEPIILLYGQSGVGKSSLLAAGLLPRLEADCQVVYRRRDAGRGLAAELDEVLARQPGQNVRDCWLALEAAGKPLVVVLDQVEEAVTRANPALASEVGDFLDRLVTLFDDPTQRPCGRLILGFRGEWLAQAERLLQDRRLPYTGHFLARLSREGIVEAIVGPSRPGRLQESYHLTVEPGLAEEIAGDLLVDAGSALAPTLQILLSKLWTRARQNNPGQPSFTRDLYQGLRRQGLLLNDFLSEQLDALRSRDAQALESGLAIDLLYFHTTAEGNSAHRTRAELLAEYADKEAQVVDLAAACRDLYLLVEVMRTREADPQTDAEPATQLAHDTLAPLVRARHERSPAPGQRGRRILEGRAGRPEQPVEHPAPLDEVDLARVEAGQPGMRSWRPHERQLVEASRAQRAQRQAEGARRRRRAQMAIAAIVLLAIVGLVLAVWATNAANDARDAEATAIAESTRANAEADNARAAQAAEATAAAQAEAESTRAVQAQATAEASAAIAAQNAAKSRAGELVARTQGVLAQDVYDPSLALLLAGQAVSTTLGPYGFVVPDAERTLQRSLSAAQASSWRMSLPREYHTGEVHAATFSPDGRQILTASEDQTARLWNVTDGRQQVSFVGHRGGVFAARFSPDGRTVATAGQDGTLRFWNPQTGTQLRVLEVHSDTVRSLVFSPDGQRILTASLDGTARLWDVASGEQRMRLKHAEGWVLSAKFSPDGQTIVTTGADKTARLWDAADGQPLAPPLVHASWVRNAAFSPDGRRLVTVDQSGAVRVWDAVTGAELAPFPPQPFDDDVKHKELHGIAFSPDGTRAVTVDMHGQIVLREGTTGEVLATRVGHHGSVSAVSFSPDGRLLVTAGEDYTTHVWEAGSGKHLLTIGGHIEVAIKPGVSANDVRSAAFSPDGATLATASKDGMVHLWDVATGAEIRALQAHTDTVRAVAYSPSGEQLATAGEDTTIHLWDADTGEAQRTLEGYTGTVTSAAFSPDSRWLVTGGQPARADIWDVQTGRVVQALVGHTATVRSAVFSPDGLTVLTGSEDSTARLWEAATGRQLRQLRRHTGAVLAVAFSRDGRSLATASRDATAVIWDVATGQALATMVGHEGAINGVAFSPDGKSLLTAGSDSSARLWEVATGREQRRLLGHGGALFAGLFSPDQQTIATASADGTARLWNYDQTLERRVFSGHTALVRYATFNPDDSLIVSAGEDRRPWLWDAHTGRPLRRLIGHEEAVWSAEFSPDGKTLLTASQDGTIRLWDTATARQMISATVDISATKDTLGVSYAGFSPDGTQLVTASNDRLVRLWSIEPLTVTRVLTGHRQPVLMAAFSPDGRLLATASADGLTRLWEVVSGNELRQLAGHNNWVWFVAFSHDGARLVTAGGDGTARVWRVDTGEQTTVLVGHRGLVRTAQFSPDDKRIITAGEDQTMRLWDAASGQELSQLLGHTAEVWYAGFSHDGKTLVSASFDTTVRLWDPDIFAALARAQMLIQRDPPLFTLPERQDYGLDPGP